MATDSEGPSPDEVRRWVDRLYDRAESDTGRFNATRAAAIPRQRDAAARGRSQGDAEPAVGTLARKWFDAARAKLGPTVPAWHAGQEVQARPDRAPRAARPARQLERPAEPRALEAPPAPTGAALELTSGSAATPATEFLPKLPEQRAVPTAPGRPRQNEGTWPTGAQSALDADMVAWPLYEPSSVPAPEFSPQSTAVLPAVPDHTAVPPSVLDHPAVLPSVLDHPAVLPSVPDHTAALPALPDPAGVLPDALAHTAGAHRADLPANGTESYGAGQAAVATAPHATALAADLTAGADGGMWPAPDQVHSTRTERVIAFARAQIGRPCVWGAVGPGSYDAAGLTQAAWKTAGVTLPRTAQAQWGAGVQVSLAEALFGDLVFFHDDLGHVGIWSGDGMMIHAPGPGALIREESVFFAGQSAIKGVVRPA
ncbi:NlpC/P60 family protein [Streptomyces tibetensis]|uniref:C40 family peptidase n=1 Tax=Streptomyces tibetensis TaxID=2382123 RepID=UPI0033DD113B